jgi:hypothetical protein
MVTAVATTSVVVNIVLLVVLVYRREWRQYKAVMEDEGDAVTHRPRFRRFVANRHKDVTGISGNGVRVEGVVFSDGWGVTHWLDMPPMREPKTEVWHRPWWRRRGPDPFTKISGHGGATEVVWIDAS